MVASAFVPVLLLLIIGSAHALQVERLPVAGPSAVSAAGGAARLGREVASGRAFVQFSAGISSGAAAAVSAAGFELVKGGYPGGWALVWLPEGMSVAAGLAVLRSLPEVSAAEPSSVYRVKIKPSDPALVLQYACARPTARAWDYEPVFSSRVTVAVMDTGIDGSHPDLSPKLAESASSVTLGPSKLAGADDASAPNNPRRPPVIMARGWRG